MKTNHWQIKKIERMQTGIQGMREVNIELEKINRDKDSLVTEALINT